MQVDWQNVGPQKEKEKTHKVSPSPSNLPIDSGERVIVDLYVYVT